MRLTAKDDALVGDAVERLLKEAIGGSISENDAWAQIVRMIELAASGDPDFMPTVRKITSA